MKHVYIGANEQAAELDEYFSQQYSKNDDTKWSWPASAAFITLLSCAGWVGVMLLIF
jgi:hypothetical protein